MNTTNIDKAGGHWLLAKVGKRVLRPGGRLLTQRLIDAMSISPKDRVVELAPGMGHTARVIIQKEPASYIGIDTDQEVVQLLQKKLQRPNVSFQQGNASETNLPAHSCDKIIGEAMLTMHADHRKKEIIEQAHNVLVDGGLYGIHELALVPEDISADLKQQIQRELAETIKVNARPLTKEEWKSLLEDCGFEVQKIEYAPMHLLQPGRIIEDEGFLRFLKIAKNIMLQSDIRHRIMQMKNIFKKYENNMQAIMIIAKKTTKGL